MYGVDSVVAPSLEGSLESSDFGVVSGHVFTFWLWLAWGILKVQVESLYQGHLVSRHRELRHAKPKMEDLAR